MPNIAKLQQLLDYVTTLPTERIKMNTWADGLDANECGTSACLGGHATALFPKEIQLRRSQHPGSLARFYIQHLNTDEDDDRDDGALRIVFELDENELNGDDPVDLLFSGGRTPEKAIADLEKFIIEHS